MEAQFRIHFSGISIFSLFLFGGVGYAYETVHIPTTLLIVAIIVIFTMYVTVVACKVDDYDRNDSHHKLFTASIILAVILFLGGAITSIVAGDKLLHSFVGEILGGVLGFVGWIILCVCLGIVFLGISSALDVLAKKAENIIKYR